MSDRSDRAKRRLTDTSGTEVLSLPDNAPEITENAAAGAVLDAILGNKPDPTGILPGFSVSVLENGNLRVPQPPFQSFAGEKVLVDGFIEITPEDPLYAYYLDQIYPGQSVAW